MIRLSYASTAIKEFSAVKKPVEQITAPKI